MGSPSEDAGVINSQLQPIIDQFTELQNQVNAGKLSQAEYIKQAEPIFKDAQKNIYGWSRISSNVNSLIGDTVQKFNDLNTNFNIYKSANQYLGREITPGELAQAVPAFGGPDGAKNGNAFLANLAQQYRSNPALDPGSKQNTQKPADVSGSVQQQFQSVLGRAPTQDELTHFTQAIQSNQTDAYGLGNFLKQMPEYTNAQDTQFRGGLNTELQNYDTQEFGRERKDIEADYARRGINAGASPSLDYALTDLMGKIAQNRSAYLASLSSSQYGGNKDLAIGNYQNSLNQMYGQQQGNLQNSQNMSNALMQRGWQGQDYRAQMNDYMQYLNSQPRGQGNGFGGFLAGATQGATAGGMAGGPWGALAGGLAGGVGGYLNQRSPY